MLAATLVFLLAPATTRDEIATCFIHRFVPCARAELLHRLVDAHLLAASEGDYTYSRRLIGSVIVDVIVIVKIEIPTEGRLLELGDELTQLRMRAGGVDDLRCRLW